MNQLKVALIGSGNIAHHHAKAIKKIKNIKLVAVCGRDKEKVEKFGKKYKINTYTDYDRLLKNEEIDMVDIVSVPSLHAGQGIKAAKLGKHVLVEKPIDISIERADQLIKVCKEKDVKLSVISQHRFDKVFRIVKKMIEKGEFGRIVSIVVSLQKYRPQCYYNSWRGDKNYSGGGVVICHAIHYIDLLLWLMGPAKSVVGKISSLNRSKVEDTGFSIIKFKNGSTGIINTTSVVSSLPTRIEIYGEKKSMIIEENRIVRINKGNSYIDRFLSLIKSKLISLIPLPKNSFKEQIKDFVNAIKNNKNLLITGEDGKRALEVVLAIYESDKENKEILLK